MRPHRLVQRRKQRRRRVAQRPSHARVHRRLQSVAILGLHRLQIQPQSGRVLPGALLDEGGQQRQAEV